MNLTEKQKTALYELLGLYLYDKKNPPTIGMLGVSVQSYVELVKIYEKIMGLPKSDYKDMLEKLTYEKE